MLLGAILITVLGAVIVYIERGGIGKTSVPHGILVLIQFILAIAAIGTYQEVAGWLSNDLDIARTFTAGIGGSIVAIWLSIGTGYLINPAGPKQTYNGSDGGAKLLQLLHLIPKENGQPMGNKVYWSIQAVNVGIPAMALSFFAGWHCLLLFPLTVLAYWKVAPLLSGPFNKETEFVGAGLAGALIYGFLTL